MAIVLAEPWSLGRDYGYGKGDGTANAERHGDGGGDGTAGAEREGNGDGDGDGDGEVCATGMDSNVIAYCLDMRYGSSSSSWSS